MGCISSKLAGANQDREGGVVLRSIVVAGDCRDHVVSLTSSTYGVLRLDDDEEETSKRCHYSPPLLAPFRRSVSKEEPTEIIDALELMGDLEEAAGVVDDSKKTARFETPGKKAGGRGASGAVLHSPKEIVPVIDYSTPRKQRRSDGKENQGGTPPQPPDGLVVVTAAPGSTRALKPLVSIENVSGVVAMTPSMVRYKCTPSPRIQVAGKDPCGLSSRRRSLSPLFDPELVASFEKELSEEKEQIKVMVSQTPKRRQNSRDSSAAKAAAALLESFEPKCPPGGEDAVVLYTTTLRGIRKTFEDCNAARSCVDSYGVQVMERDISMDSGFREELRVLMEKKDVRVPVVFVKGRLVGGADDVLRLEEEGKLGVLLEGIPKRTAAWCDGCGGMRFVMCMDCNGSCKVLDEEEMKVVKCEECNENGLIHCPICS